LIVVAGVVGYFTGSAAVPPVQTITITAGVGTPVTITQIKTITQTVAATPTPEKVYRWRMAAHIPAGDTRWDVDLYFASLVKNMSGGRLVIEVYPGGELFPVPQTFDMVSKRVVEMAEIFFGYWVAEDPVMALASSIPGPLTTPDDIRYFWLKTQDIIRKHVEARGVLLLGPLCVTPTEIFFSRKPVKSVEELKGLIIRSAGVSAKFYELLGLKVVTLTAGEVYTALQLGTIDAAEWAEYEGTYKMGFAEVAKYVLEAPPGYSLHSEAYADNYVLVNPQAWAELPDDLKAIVLAAIDATYTWSINRMYFQAALKGKELWIKAGAQITTLSVDEAKKLMNVAIQLYINIAKQSPDALEFIKRFVEVCRDLRYTEWADAIENGLKSAGLI